MTNDDLEMAKMVAINSGDIQGQMFNLIQEIDVLQAKIEKLTATASLGNFYDDVHERNVKAGWWTDIKTGQPLKRNVGEMLVLVVTELAEAFDAYTKGAMDDKLPQFPGLGVELGDVEIRLADFIGALRAGRVVNHTLGTFNPGEDYFLQIKKLAAGYEAIRKTPQAVGEAETGDYLPPMDVVPMIAAKLDFNASRADHQIANRLKDGGKRT